MRSFRFAFFTFAIAAVAAVACSDHHDSEPQAYATLQSCFQDHHIIESLAADKSIAICCAEHPIAGVTPACGATAAECETFVEGHLDGTVEQADITAGCADYITQISQ